MAMLVAMAITAFLCIFIGVFPGTLYATILYPFTLLKIDSFKQ